MRERIAQYLQYKPRNKVIFAAKPEPCFRLTDLGYELSCRLEPHLQSKQLPMIADDALKAVFASALTTDDVIGKYIALTNWGILFEDELGLNLSSFLSSYSRGQTLIFFDSEASTGFSPSSAEDSKFSSLLDSISPYIIQ